MSSKLITDLEAPTKVVQEVITRKLFYDISEANLTSIANQVSACSNVIKTHSKGATTYLTSAESSLTKEMSVFETVIKGLIEDQFNMDLRAQLNPKSYQLLGRFQQVLFAAHEVSKSNGPISSSLDLKLDLEPLPEWVREAEEKLKKLPVEALMEQCEQLKKPQPKQATHAMCVNAIMEHICAGTHEGKYRDWWINATHEIEVFKTYISAGQGVAVGSGPYSARLAAHANAIKEKDQYYANVVEKMDVEALNEVLRKWGLPPGGPTEGIKARLLGYLNDPFYCDDEIFRDNYTKLVSIANDKSTVASVNGETSAQETKLKSILASAPPCPKTKSTEFAAQSEINVLTVNGSSSPSAVNGTGGAGGSGSAEGSRGSAGNGGGGKTRGPKPTQNHIDVKKAVPRVDPFTVATSEAIKYSVPPQTKGDFTGFDIECKRGYVYTKFPIGKEISSSGRDGEAGSKGADGSKGSDGDDAKIPGQSGEEGRPGADGTEGQRGTNGSDAKPIALSLTYTKDKKLQVSGFEKDEISLPPGQILFVQATGGNGGAGGNGGNGGDGGKGGDGADGENGKNGKDGSSYGISADDGTSGGAGGNGGTGGDGGMPGRGGQGGNGGKGGDVKITVDDPKLLVLVEGNSLGGNFGPGGAKGQQGNGGPGGKAGKGGTRGLGGKAIPEDSTQQGSAGRDGRDGSDGPNGLEGERGWDGAINFDGDDGSYGPDGTVTYEISQGGKVIEKSNVKFCPVVQGYTILDENSDGVFEPGTKINVSKIAWENCGGLTFPKGGTMMLTLDDKICTSCPPLVLDALPAKGKAVVPGSLWAELPTVVVPHSGPAKVTCTISTQMHLLEHYPFFGGKLPTIVEVRYPVEISTLDVPRVVAPGGEYKIKITVKNVSSKPIAAGDLEFQATIAEVAKQVFPLIPAFASSHLELSYKADESAELYSVIAWSAKMMYKGTHIENAYANVRVAPIYDFDRPPQTALLVTGSNMDLQSFRIWKRIFETLNITFDMWDLDSMQGLSFHEETKRRFHWAPRYEGKLMVMSLPTHETLNALDVGDIIQPLNKNTGLFLLLASPRHLTEKLFAESPEVEKYSEKEFTGRHTPFFTPSQYDVYKAIQSVRKKHEKKDRWRVVQVKHTVDKQTKLGAMLWSYGECEVRKMPLPKGTRLINLAALAPIGPPASPRTPPASPSSSAAPPSPLLLSSSSSSSLSSLTPSPSLPQDNILSQGCPADIATTNTFTLPSRFVQAFVGTLVVLPPAKKIEFLVNLPSNPAYKWSYIYGKHSYTTTDVIAETIYYDLKHEFWENDKDKFPATTEYIGLATKSTVHENSQLVVQVVLSAIFRLDKLTHRNTSAQKKMLKSAMEQLDKVAAIGTKKQAKAQVASKIKLGPLLHSYQFPTNGESKVERLERKAAKDKLAKKTVFGRAKLGIFGKSK